MSVPLRVLYAGTGAVAWSAPSFLVAPFAEWLWAWLFPACAAYGVWRGATVRVRESAEGVFVRNVVRTFDLAWPDVTEVGWFDLDGSWVVPKGYVSPWLRVRGRRWRVPVLAMATWMRPSRAGSATVRRWSEHVAA